MQGIGNNKEYENKEQEIGIIYGNQKSGIGSRESGVGNRESGIGIIELISIPYYDQVSRIGIMGGHRRSVSYQRDSNLRCPCCRE